MVTRDVRKEWKKGGVAVLNWTAMKSHPRRGHLNKELKEVKWILVGYIVQIIFGLSYK